MYAVWTALFFLTACISAWAAYSPIAAGQKLALLTVGLVIVFVIDRISRIDAEATFVWGGVGCALLAVGISTLALLPDLAPFSLRMDSLAAVLVLLLPLAGGSFIWFWQHNFRAVAPFVVLCITWALLMLFMTAERSAWFALAGGLLCGWVLKLRFARARCKRSVWPLDSLGIGVAIAVLAAYVLMIALPDFQARLPLGERLTVVDHLDAWRNGLVLIQDYSFTGSGLGATGMVYSSYVLLHHVPVLNHLHNLFLQLAIEQGLPGLVAFVGMVAVAGFTLLKSWQSGSRADDELRMMAAAALATMLWHGLFDSELYSSWLVPVLFLPIAFVLVAARLDQYVIDDFRLGRQKRTLSRRLMSSGVSAGVVGAAIIAVAALALASTPTVQAAFQANLGAVAQTRAELSVYSWPQWAIQDEVRRSDALSLKAATARYEAALQLDPQNGTALRRLGQIALSRGEYEVALRYLEEAYAHAPQQRIIHLLLGEALTVNGDVEKGTALWNGTAIDIAWINQRRWWYTYIGDTHRADLLMNAIALRGRQEDVSP